MPVLTLFPTGRRLVDGHSKDDSTTVQIPLGGRNVQNEILEARANIPGQLARDVFGPMFRKLRLNDSMPLWTDDYSDVLSALLRMKLGL